VVLVDRASADVLTVEGIFSSESAALQPSGYCPLGFGDDSSFRKVRAEAAERSMRPVWLRLIRLRKHKAGQPACQLLCG
jgi:hypothetical protein